MLMGGHSSPPAFGFAPDAAAPAADKPSRAATARDAVESWTSTAADVEAFVKRARPGDRFVYATGPTLVQGAAAALVRKLDAAGEVAAHNRRNKATGGLEYVIIRNRIRVVTQRPPVCTPLMMAVLVELQDAAMNKRRCPSDAEIGLATGMTADQVKWQMKKLEEIGLIIRRMVPAPGDNRFRVVKVIATGHETACPGCAK